MKAEFMYRKYMFILFEVLPIASYMFFTPKKKRNNIFYIKPVKELRGVQHLQNRKNIQSNTSNASRTDSLYEWLNGCYVEQ